MIRRGHLKYIHCDIFPVFNLLDDPNERHNLADHPDYADAC